MGDECILRTLKSILKEVMSGDSIKIDNTTPLNEAYCNINAIDCVLFLLEVSCSLNVELSNDIIENLLHWSLTELSAAVKECPQLNSKSLNANAQV